MRFKRFTAGVVAAVMAVTAVATPLCDNIPTLERGLSASAYYSVKDSFYPVALTGDGAVDMVNVAVAQAGRKDDDDGWYPNREAWCADFVLDVARVAGQTGAVPDAPANAACGTFRNALVKAGAMEVETAQAGDLVFYCSTSGDTTYHVGIMKDSRYSVEGNALLNGVFQVVDNRDTMTYTTTKGLSIANGDIKMVFIRPNYSNSTNDVAVTSIVASELAKKINWLSTQYKHGEYWNQYNGSLDKTGPTPCPCKAMGYTWCGQQHNGYCDCKCGVFHGGEQCYGFASKMFYLTFGIYQENAEKIYSINDVCAGDVIRYGGTAGHSVFVIKVIGDTIYYVDCNGNGVPCQVRWNATVNKWGKVAGYSFGYRYHMSGNTIKDPWNTPDPVKDSTPPNLTSLGEEDWNRNGMGFLVRANATDNVGVTKIAFTVSANGRTKDYQANLEKNNTYGWQYISVSDFSNFLGTYSISCAAYDACGNKSNVRSMTVTLDKGTAPTVADKTIKEGTYCLRNGVGLNMDVSGGTDENKNPAVFYEHNGSAAQRMKFIYKGNGKYLIAPECSTTGKVIDVYRPTDGDMDIDWGDRIDLYQNDDDEAQEFYVVPVGNGDYVLELASKDNFVIGGKHTFSGANFYLQPYLNFAPSQRFRFTDASGNAVDVCNHSYKETRTEPTCTAGGKLTKVCKYCGKKVEETINALGHSWSGWSTTTYPTCTAQGVEQRTCSRCSKAETRYITALGHNYSSQWTIDKPATCSAEGSKSRHCTRCDAKTEVTAIAKIAHTYTSKVVKPTLTEQGYTLYTCSVCGYSYKDNYTAVRENPSKVTGLAFGARSADYVSLKWNKDANADGYIVEYLSGNKFVKLVDKTSGLAVSYKVTGLEAGTLYKFRIRSYVNENGKRVYGEYSDVLNVRTLPKAMSNLKLGARTDNSISLKWDKNETANGAVVEMYKNGQWVVIATKTSNTAVSHKITGLDASTAYKFRVRAYINDEGGRIYSVYNTTLNEATAPAAVKNFRSTITAKTAIRFNWDKNTTADGYSFEMIKNSKWTTVATIEDGTATNYSQLKLNPGTAYRFRIRAYKVVNGKKIFSGYSYVNASTAK